MAVFVLRRFQMVGRRTVANKKNRATVDDDDNMREGDSDADAGNESGMDKNHWDDDGGVLMFVERVEKNEGVTLLTNTNVYNTGKKGDPKMDVWTKRRIGIDKLVSSDEFCLARRRQMSQHQKPARDETNCNCCNSSCSRCWKVGKSWIGTEGKPLWRREGKTSDRGEIMKIEKLVSDQQRGIFQVKYVSWGQYVKNGTLFSYFSGQRHEAKPEINEAGEEEEET
ncbi:Protein CBG12080 [Caenorhabditis briggsae]|uniref:Protein CBG12080 n=1 Tax=Caenorhabditis briggsae TaxID=6238 RepID=A8XEI2_CAEBR|nr:Protein CBG12080 [Caenorhabditis briggsae]CAP31117.1 Protein CBG12080 [Caenorhabditis briggsae]